jgi:hypothetical protein
MSHEDLPSYYALLAVIDLYADEVADQPEVERAIAQLLADMEAA